MKNFFGRHFLTSLITVLTANAFLIALPQNSYSQVSRSPFTRVQFQNPHVQVEHAGTTYFLIKISGTPIEQIMAACMQKFGANCQKSFALDFTPTMAALGFQIGAVVDLELYFFPTHRLQLFQNVPVTAENQQLVINRF